jgi:hypothetical protein
VAGVRRPGLEADHSPPSTTEVNNDETIHPLTLCLQCIVLKQLSPASYT